MPLFRRLRSCCDEFAFQLFFKTSPFKIDQKFLIGLAFATLEGLSSFCTIRALIVDNGFGQMDWTSTDQGTISKNLDKVDLSKFDMSKFFNNSWVNAFMMINVVLGLVLLDNYLSNKRKEFRKQ